MKKLLLIITTALLLIGCSRSESIGGKLQDFIQHGATRQDFEQEQPAPWTYRPIPQCPEDVVLIGQGNFKDGRWDYYVCGPAVDDYVQSRGALTWK